MRNDSAAQPGHSTAELTGSAPKPPPVQTLRRRDRGHSLRPTDPGRPPLRKGPPARAGEESRAADEQERRRQQGRRRHRRDRPLDRRPGHRRGRPGNPARPPRQSRGTRPRWKASTSWSARTTAPASPTPATGPRRDRGTVQAAVGRPRAHRHSDLPALQQQRQHPPHEGPPRGTRRDRRTGRSKNAWSATCASRKTPTPCGCGCTSPASPRRTSSPNSKANGFRWAPSERAWQRQLTPSARWAADRVLGASDASPRLRQRRPELTCRPRVSRGLQGVHAAGEPTATKCYEV